MAEYTKIKTARTIICDFCNQLYQDDPCEPADCDWLRMLEEDAADVAPKWINVKDRTPEDNDRVIAFRPNEAEVSAYRYSVMWGWALKTSVSHSGITHWMPLPNPPKGENDG